MDLQMPVMDGFEATRQIRAMEDPQKKALPIIAMSARALRGDKEKSLAAGLNAHVTKPIDPEEFYQELCPQRLQEAGGGIQAARADRGGWNCCGCERCGVAGNHHQDRHGRLRRNGTLASSH